MILGKMIWGVGRLFRWKCLVDIWEYGIGFWIRFISGDDIDVGVSC